MEFGLINLIFFLTDLYINLFKFKNILNYLFEYLNLILIIYLFNIIFKFYKFLNKTFIYFYLFILIILLNKL